MSSNIDSKILCNLCAESMCPNITTLSGSWSSGHPHGLIGAKATGGYESYHLLDMNRYTFNLCETCLRQLFIQCKIKPLIEDVEEGVPLQEYSWEKDQEIYEYRLWTDSGGAHQAYLNKKCNMKKDCPNKAVYTRMINDHFSEECTCEEHKGTDSVSYKYVKFIPNILKPFL